MNEFFSLFSNFTCPLNYTLTVGYPWSFINLNPKLGLTFLVPGLIISVVLLVIVFGKFFRAKISKEKKSILTKSLSPLIVVLLFSLTYGIWLLITRIFVTKFCYINNL